MSEIDPFPTWQPTASLATAMMRARMLHAARDFFAAHNILEVDTPSLSTAAVSDPHIETMTARLSADPHRDYFLHTSPEFAMKRLLCNGWPDIYQICKVYRDGEVGRRHQPEFTMAEWYRHGFDLDGMMRHTAELLERLLEPSRVTAAPVYLAYREAFQLHAGVDPLITDLAELKAASGADAELSYALGDDRDHWLDLLLTSRVAPHFHADRLTVLHHYPASQAALARLCPTDAALADRFEIFYGELELANGYVELNDADEQLARCHQDQDIRSKRALPVRPLDEKFIEALRSGLPECSGVAVGFDRLVMINAGTDKLSDVQTFTVMDHRDD